MDTLTRQSLTKLRRAAKEYPSAERAYAAAAERVRELADEIAERVRELAHDVPADQLAKAAGLTGAELAAILAEQPAEPARSAPVPLADRTLADVEQTAPSGVTRQSTGRFARRRTIFVHMGRGHVYDPDTDRGWKRAAPMTLAHVLAECLGTGAERVMIADGPDWCVRDGDASRAAAVVRTLGEPIPGWVTGERGHYVSDPDTPVGHWRHESGRKLELHRAASWFGTAGEYDARMAGRAWRWLDAAIAERWPGSGLLSTPSTTGRALWLASLPRGAELPILSLPMRAFIKSTSGQGRAELLAPRGVAELPGAWLYDGRLMYGALTYGMPVGEPTMWAGEPQEPGRVLMAPGRWRITARVPAGWDHVGLIGAPRDGSRQAWHYPSTPGESMSTWCSGREVLLARQHGWDVTIHEGMSWRSGKVMDKWAERLRDITTSAPGWIAAGHDAATVELVERAVRMMLLHTIGAMASIGHTVMRTAPADQPGLAADARPIDGIRQEGDTLVWHERQPMDPWAEQSSHPEYSAEIWARARLRLLVGAHDYPDMGALSLPRASVLAFDTDALYVAEDPQWADDGKAGRLRLKASTGPLAYPRSLQELRDTLKGS